MSDRFLDGDCYEHEPPCFCAPAATDPLGATAEFCPMHGDPAKPVPEPEYDELGGCCGEDENGVVHHVRDPEGDEAAHG